MDEVISKVLRIHYYLMESPRFWYDPALIEASKVLCVIASDLRATGEVRDLRLVMKKV